RLRDTMAQCAGLPRKPAPGNRAVDVILTGAVGDREGLLDQHAQDRPREIGLDRPRVDDDLARPRLEPDARDGILALAGRIGPALLVEFLNVLRRFGGRGLKRGQTFERLDGIGHYALLAFLRFMEATSIVSGCCASCGCAEPL